LVKPLKLNVLRSSWDHTLITNHKVGKNWGGKPRIKVIARGEDIHRV
jgi:hypothetical protein